jgi:hypothetical protein
MSDFRKKIEDLMSAISFAEEGEFGTSREILKEGKRVLLAVREGRIDRKTLKYALNTSKRVGADLDILYISSAKDVNPALKEFFGDLRNEGISYRVIQKTGCLKQEIISYTESKREILFVVIESSDNLDIECSSRGKRLSESWRNLKCPLVVVSEAV